MLYNHCQYREYKFRNSPSESWLSLELQKFTISVSVHKPVDTKGNFSNTCMVFKKKLSCFANMD